MVRRAARKAVSPEVMGSTMTPRIASRPPKEPISAREDSYTTLLAVPALMEAASAAGSW